MKSESKSLSVIIVVHQEYLKYLPKALSALTSQTLNDFETIIVANGCEYEDAIETFPCTLAEACNIGISQAQGEYIVRLDADDWLDQELLEVEYNYLEANPSLDAVWCDYIAAREISKSESHTTHSLSYHPNPNLEHACGVMFRRSAWEELDGYDEDLKYQESFDFWSRFNKKYKAGRIQRPLYIYRRGHESMSANPERLEVRRRLEVKYGH